MEAQKLKRIAAEHTAAGRFHDAIAAYRSLIEQFPSDPATWLKLGDLYTRISDAGGAIQAYDNVGRYYQANGSPLKAISVFRRTRELILRSAPSELPRYLHIAVCTAECCEQLGLPGDAFNAYADAAADFLQAKQEEQALEAWTRMSRLDPSSPLPHLNAGEFFVQRGDNDAALSYFRQALDILLGAEKNAEALKVVGRILRFHRDGDYARLSADLHLRLGGPSAALRAIRDLQLSYELDPRDLDTMALLIRAFEVLGQDDHAIEVRKELARVALEDGRQDRFSKVMAELERLAPNDADVAEIKKAKDGRDAGLSRHDFIEGVFDDAESTTGQFGSDHISSAPPPSESQPRRTSASSPGSNSAMRRAAGDPEGRERLLSHIDDLLDAGDAHSAINPLRDAIHRDPHSLLLREKLRDLFQLINYADGVRNELNAIAAIHARNGNYRHALRLVNRILAETPEDEHARKLKEQLTRVPGNKSASAK